MKISFSTLGCPGWDLDQICRAGQASGYDGVDFRGYLETLDITMLPMFTRDGEITRRRLGAAGLVVSAISSGITLCDASRYAQNVEEARRTIETANALGAKIVRVFGGGSLETASREQLAQNGLTCMQEILSLEGARDLRWLFETHDLWICSEDISLLLDAIPEPFGALWDVGHTPRVGGESLEETFEAIGVRIGYTHFKDALFEPDHPQAMADGWRYVLPGEGQLPLQEAVLLLARHGYDGWLQFEHEKRWHPTLAEPEIAIPAFAAWARGIQGLGRAAA